jgi:AcrR family transcriptional regulator
MARASEIGAVISAIIRVMTTAGTKWKPKTMPRRRAQHGTATRRAILRAAGRLFAARRYDDVTMRQIAKDSGCSHTAIYMYFRNKEALLNELAAPPLEKLESAFDRVLGDSRISGDDRLQRVCTEYIVFSLRYRNLYRTIIETRSARVDKEYAEASINRHRVRLFELLSAALRNALALGPEDTRILTFSRILFYLLHGIAATYTQSEESSDALLKRLAPTFEASVRVVLTGLRQEIAGTPSRR